MAGKQLFIFTNSYPYGNGYNWLDGEIEVLSHHFETITILPYSYEGNRKAKSLPSYPNVTIEEPLLADDVKLNLKKDWIYLLSPRLIYYLKEFFFEKVYQSSYWLKNWLHAAKKTEILLNSERYRRLKKLEVNQAVGYFYWGNNQTLMIPFLNKKGLLKTLVRFHGFDLYKDRLGGYQPFRRELLKNLTIAAPISQFGLNYLQKEYADIEFQIRVLRLGVEDKGRSSASQDGIIRLVSCARLIQLKRIHWIPRILKKVDIPIEWTHIGDGDYRHLVDQEISDMPGNTTVKLLGWMPPAKVPEYYRDHPIDIFISVSESEGIPVSIMEALAAGIPVFSTDVGGISEIINEKVGRLVSPDFDEDQMADELELFIKNYLADASKFRDNAYAQFSKYCDLERCNANLLESLLLI